MNDQGTSENHGRDQDRPQRSELDFVGFVVILLRQRTVLLATLVSSLVVGSIIISMMPKTYQYSSVYLMPSEITPNGINPLVDTPDVSKIVTQNILPQTVENTLNGIAGGEAMTSDALRWFKVNTSDRTIELTMEVTQEWQDTGSEIMGKVMDGLASRMANEYDQRTKPLNLMITTLDDTTVPKDSTGASDIYQAKAFLADMMSKLIAGQIIIPKSLTSRPTGMSPPVMYVILFICSCIVAIIVALFCEVLGQARSRLNTPVA